MALSTVLLAVFFLISSCTVLAQTSPGTGTPAPTTPGTGTPAPTTPGTGTGVPTTPGTSPTPTTGQTIVNPLKVKSIDELLLLILDAVIKLGAVILTLALIWIGFLFVAAQGNPEKITSARTALIWTIVGGLILLGAKGILAVIQSTVSAL